MRVYHPTKTNPAGQPQASSGASSLVDRFTVGHAAAGALLGLSGANPVLVLSLMAGWEFVGEPLGMAHGVLFPERETTANKITDGAALLSAYIAMRALNARAKASQGIQPAQR